MRLKGFVLEQTLVESVVIVILVTMVFPAVQYYRGLGFREDVKLKCLELNVQAAQEIQEAYRQTGDPDIFDYEQATDDYTTAVTSADCVAGSLYRLAIETRHRGRLTGETGVIIYAAGY